MNAVTPALPAPIGLLAELTHRCPLRCAYCSNPLELDRRSGEIDTVAWTRVLSEDAQQRFAQIFRTVVCGNHD